MIRPYLENTAAIKLYEDVMTYVKKNTTRHIHELDDLRQQLDKVLVEEIVQEKKKKRRKMKRHT